MSSVLFYVDRDSFPVKCGELSDFYQLINGDVIEEKDTSPTAFFNKALSYVDYYELVVPVTRNMFIRDRLLQEGVSLVICL